MVDPRFEVDEYLELARYMGVSIEHVLETHNHADHVSGHGRLAAATGATIHIHRLAEPDYEHEPFDDGWELELGALRVRALHTPGHRPEHTAFALIDTARSERPWAVLTGDTLFVNDVARPDLAIEKAEGARGIFRSLRDKLLTLPPECEVWPGHLGGSMCGGPGMDMKISSTIGYERAANPTLAIDEEDAFVEQALAALGPQPPNFQNIVALNRGELLTVGVEVLPLAPRQVEQKRAAGALLVDVRTDQQFDDAHIPGAVCNPMLTAGFGSKLAWIGDPERRARVRRPRRRGRPARGAAGAVGRAAAARRLPARRDDELAAGEAPDRARRADAARGAAQARRARPDPRRPRALGVRRRPHPRLGVHALARHRRAARRARPARARSRSCARRASGPRPRRASSCARARAR